MTRLTTESVPFHFRSRLNLTVSITRALDLRSHRFETRTYHPDSLSSRLSTNSANEPESRPEPEPGLSSPCGRSHHQGPSNHADAHRNPSLPRDLQTDRGRRACRFPGPRCETVASHCRCALSLHTLHECVAQKELFIRGRPGAVNQAIRGFLGRRASVTCASNANSRQRYREHGVRSSAIFRAAGRETLSATATSRGQFYFLRKPLAAPSNGLWHRRCGCRDRTYR